LQLLEKDAEATAKNSVMNTVFHFLKVWKT